MRVGNRAVMDKEDLRHMTGAQFAELGVCLVGRSELMLECNDCGETWEPQLDASGKLPFDFWICPLKCNAKDQVQ